MCVHTVYIYYVYINTHTCMYIFKKNMLCIYIKYTYKLYQLHEFIYVTLEHKSSVKSLGYICSNRQKYTVWVKIINFSFMPKIIRILRSCSMKIFSTFLTVNISKLNF